MSNIKEISIEEFKNRIEIINALDDVMKNIYRHNYTGALAEPFIKVIAKKRKEVRALIDFANKELKGKRKYC